MPINNILVIVDPTSDRQPAFARALDSARDTGAAVHLYACAGQENGYTDEAAARQELQPLLDSLALKVAESGRIVTSEIEWSDDWAQYAVAAAARIGASMVFKSSFDHSSVQRELRPTSDWTLLRMSPCPVLLVKDFHGWQHRRVLAAINPGSTEAAHVKLDHQIISLAQQMSSTYGSDAHFVTAFQDLNHAPDAGKIAGNCGTQADHVHLKQGKADEVIRDVAKELDVDLIIVGTVARDGIKGRVVGNTCERLLDKTHSDLLVLN